jgi:hypothetical protein
VELNVVAYGQWNLARPADKERMEVAPPLREDNILTTQEVALFSRYSTGEGTIGNRYMGCDRTAQNTEVKG